MVQLSARYMAQRTHKILATAWIFCGDDSKNSWNKWTTIRNTISPTPKKNSDAVIPNVMPLDTVVKVPSFKAKKSCRLIVNRPAAGGSKTSGLSHPIKMWVTM